MCSMVLFMNDSKAQVSVGANVGFFKFFDADAQLGFNISGKYAINKQMNVGMNLGYYSKSTSVFGNRISFITMPITGLFEYNFTGKDFRPYVGADLGLYRLAFSGGIGNSIGGGYFGLAPVVGFNYSLSKKLSLNSNLKYHYVMSDFSTSAIGLNVGVVLKF